ncbi:MAG: aromatic ring-hydroxylating dioxygenase subunit alpha [Pseudomonadota bacterium]
MNQYTPVLTLTADELSKVTLPLEQAYTLPPSAYTSQAIYDLEMQNIMVKTWHPVARVDQVAKLGDYLSLDFLGQPLLIVHGQDDEIRVMSRVCLHRAAPLISGDGNRKLFTCPYHAWSYDTTGQLIRAPLMEEVQGFEEKKCALPQLKMELWQGFILINFDDNAAPFAPSVAGFTEYFQNFKLEQMAVVKVLEYPSTWNWKVLVDNFMEAYHHIAIHNQTLESAYHAKDSKVPDNTGPWSILHMPAAISSNVGEPAANPDLEQWQRDDLFANAIFPMFLVAMHDTSLIWYQVLPEGPEQFTLRIHICLPRHFREIENFDEIVEGATQGVVAVHEEDIHANDLVWSGLTAPLTQQGRLSGLERSIWQFNQWWVDKLLTETENSIAIRKA